MRDIRDDDDDARYAGMLHSEVAAEHLQLATAHRLYSGAPTGALRSARTVISVMPLPLSHPL